MNKSFFEVFPTLLLKKELADLMKLVYVTRVSTDRSKSHLRVYITSERWIHKKHIYELEKQIKRQFFSRMNMEVTVIEKFVLSGQYTPFNFFDVYRDSMELELKNSDNVEYSLFHQSEFEFPEDDHLVMTIPKSFIAEMKQPDIEEYLHKVFCERCGMDLRFMLKMLAFAAVFAAFMIVFRENMRVNIFVTVAYVWSIVWVLYRAKNIFEKG